MRALRSRSLRDEARQPLRIEDRLRLIKGRPREAEISGRVADRLTLLAHSAQHLVLNLDQVTSVEERVVGRERGITDSPWPRIQRVVPTQGVRFVVARRFGQLNLLCCVIGIMPSNSRASSPFPRECPFLS